MVANRIDLDNGTEMYPKLIDLTTTQNAGSTQTPRKPHWWRRLYYWIGG